MTLLFRKVILRMKTAWPGTIQSLPLAMNGLYGIITAYIATCTATTVPLVNSALETAPSIKQVL